MQLNKTFLLFRLGQTGSWEHSKEVTVQIIHHKILEKNLFWKGNIFSSFLKWIKGNNIKSFKNKCA